MGILEIVCALRCGKYSSDEFWLGRLALSVAFV